jgi:hypothetical protein
MTPRGSAEMSGVVVGISVPRKTVVRHFVPFFARDFAGLAADANSWIGEKSHFNIFLHITVPTLVRALGSFANHAVLPSLP